MAASPGEPDLGGQPLDLLLGAPMSLERFLDLAVRIAAAVSDLHADGLVHRDLKPANILVNPTTLEVRLADFGLATRLPRERQVARPPQLVEGTLPYMSPEQTGRMNRALDSRTDLYSLGVTFYQMLTGRLPFEARDPLEWIHCHVARAPSSPSQLVPELPEAVARVVMKLLAKMADDRYQTAGGLRRDLERCLAQWGSEGRIDPFPPGARDVADRLQIPQKLYGRDQELGVLLSAFERVVASGSPELVLVSGYSGIGKSSLVHELQKPLIRERGIFLGGKFDELSRGIPYSTVVRALSELVLGIMADEESAGGWREEIRRALGAHGKLMVDVVPPLELLLGAQPPVPELPPAEAERRFRRVFRDLLGVFATRPHPLMLFLDDLQWADPESLRLLEDLITDPHPRHLLLVGAYRDNEVGPSHPLARTLERIGKAGAAHGVVLSLLGLDRVVELVADALRATPERALPLAALVHEKTGGNPFFVIQFLTALHREQLLEFDAEALMWRWDIARIREKGYTDNVVEFMAGRLTALPSAARDVLGIAACIGNRGELSLLSRACDRSEDEILGDLSEPLRDGLAFRSHDSFVFAHDRFHQAAYSLVPVDRRGAVHLRIGRLLLEQTPPERLDGPIFEIVTQLDLGAALIMEREERTRVAELNLRAARKARAAAAHRAAIDFLSTGISLLGSDGWARQHQLAFALHLELAECALLSGAPDEAERLVPALLQHARTRVDQTAAYRIRIDAHSIKGEGGEAIASALECLRMFGIDMSAHPSDRDVQRAYQEVWSNLGARRIEELIDLPRMTDPELEAAMEILARLYIPAYYSDNNLFHLHLCHAVNLSLRHGNSPSSTYAYGWFGVILVSAFHRARDGYRFAKLALDLMERHQFLAYKAKAHMQMKIVALWTRPLDEMIEHTRAAFEAALETGDVPVACFSCSEAVLGMLARGDPLSEVQREAERGLDFVGKAGFSDVRQLIAGIDRFVRAMRGLTRHLSTYDDERFSEAEFESELERGRMPSLLFYHHVVKLMARFLSGDGEAALAAADRSSALLWAGLFSVQSYWFHLYSALALAAAFQRLPADEQQRTGRVLADHREQLREWAEVHPPTFENGYALVSAEVARVEGRELDAERLYAQAIRSAHENGFVQNEALAWELASRFQRARGLDLIADAYLREARAGYERWGADGKVSQLERLHPQILERRSLAPTATFAARSEQLDLLSVVKASQTISGEIRIEKLVDTLLRIVLEQGGARRGLLILARDGDLSVEAEASLGEEGVSTRILPSQAVESSLLLPVSVARYARLTRKPVILDDAAAGAGKFSTDAYFTRQRPRSLLCLPVIRQESMVGLLYLENDLVAGAFTADRLTALTLLASQVAISMENARLHLETRRAVRMRDEFLLIAAHELRTPMTSLTLSLRTLQRAPETGQAIPETVMRQSVEVAARQATRLNQLIGTLLDGSRIETGWPTLDLSSVDLGAIVRRVAERFGGELARGRCTLSIQGCSPVVGRWDASRIDQLLSNLLSNAVKFGAGKPIEVRFSQEEGTARLAVQDHGIGIEPAHQRRIFERFERAVAVQHYGGLGLGLYIGRRIAEAHGGALRLVSAPGAGSTFIVELPCAGPEPGAGGKAAAEPRA
jgi:predicted ATPase/signal transduction histidine kinase